MYSSGAKGRAIGTLKKDQLISAGSLFVISGNPLEPGSLRAVDNQGKQRMEEQEMNACPCTCTTKVAVDLIIMLYRTPPWGLGRPQTETRTMMVICIVQVQENCNPYCINLRCVVGSYGDI